MSSGSSIEWTDCTWNPVSGCTRVSAGCDNCYAVKMTNRLEGMGQAVKYGGLTILSPNGKRHFNGKVRTDEAALTIPLHWKKPRRIFVNSMSDLFHNEVPFDFIDKVFAVMALCPQHTFQILTKRPKRMAEYMANFYPEGGRLERLLDMAQISDESPFDDATDEDVRRLSEVDVLPNVWLGTSTENQKAADERIPWLLKCPAAVRFISAEPLLGPIDLRQAHMTHDKLPNWPAPTRVNWVIAGGESGPGARPCNVEWIRSIVQQCKEAGVPVFVKQMGSKPSFAGLPGEFKIMQGKGNDPSEWPEDLRVREMPK